MSMPQRGTQKAKEIVCRSCQKVYTGHHLTKDCVQCKAIPKPKRQHEHAKANCKCGKQFRKYKDGSRQTYCSAACRAKFDQRGVRDSQRAREIGSRPKPNHGLRGHRQTEEHLVKRLGSGSIRASKEELSLKPTLEKFGFKHTGEGSFWRRWKDGTLHNPDFVNHEKRLVLEYFGSYWHEKDRGNEKRIAQCWKAIGYDCIIVWSEDREAFLSDPVGSMGFGGH